MRKGIIWFALILVILAITASFWLRIIVTTPIEGNSDGKQYETTKTSDMDEREAEDPWYINVSGNKIYCKSANQDPYYQGKCAAKKARLEGDSYCKTYSGKCGIEYGISFSDPPGCCYFFLAVDYNQPQYCDNINYDWDKDKCYISLIDSNLNENFCGKIKKDIGNRERCYIRVAVTKKEPRICENIGTRSSADSDKDACYLSVVRETGDISVCKIVSGFENEANRITCYSTVAIKKKDISICDKNIESDYEREYCYRDFAVGTNDKAICNTIKTEQTRNSCYEYVEYYGDKV